MQRTQLATGAIGKQSFVGTSLVASNEVDETPNFKPDPFRHVILSRNGKSHDDAKGDTLYNRTIQAYWPLYEQAGHKEKRAVIEQCIKTMRSNGVVFVRWYRNAFIVEPRDRVKQSRIYHKVSRRLRAEVRVRTLSLTDEEKLMREETFRKARTAKRNLEKFQPLTLSKSSRNGAIQTDMFQRLMAFNDPKPRNIEKDVKIFPWGNAPSALVKCFDKWQLECRGGKKKRVSVSHATKPVKPAADSEQSGRRGSTGGIDGDL